MVVVNHCRPHRKIKLTEKAILAASSSRSPTAKSRRKHQHKTKSNEIQWKSGNESQFGLIAPSIMQRPNQKDRHLSAVARSLSRSKVDANANIAAQIASPVHHRRNPDVMDKDGKPSRSIVRSLDREMEKLALEAKHNRVVFDFNFVKNCKKKTTKVPKDVVTWEDAIPRVGVSTDGYDLLMYAPKAVGESAERATRRTLHAYAAKVPPSMYKTQKSKNKPKSYVEGPGLIAGEHRICRGWHAIGHNAPEEFGPCADYLRSTRNFNETARFSTDMYLLSHRVNVLMRTLDPTHYHDAEELKKRLSKMYPGYEAIALLDNLVYDGREVLWNVLSELHTDRQDPVFGWAILCTFREFKGGYIYLPNLGLRMRLEPGDIVFIKGRVLRHKIEEWTGGQRICVPHFTHTSVWKMVKEISDRLGADEATDEDE